MNFSQTSLNVSLKQFLKTNQSKVPELKMKLLIAERTRNGTINHISPFRRRQALARLAILGTADP